MKIFVKAKPLAKEERIEKIDPPTPELRRAGEMHFIVAVKEPPKQGRANEAIARALAEHFGVVPSAVRLVSGFSSKQKVFEILEKGINHAQFKIIKSQNIEESLSKTKRQYLVGNLSLPQILEYIHSDEIEVGISNYKGGEFEEAHFHPKQTEFQLVLWGSTEYYDISNNEIHKLGEGDFYCIEPGVKYAQRILEKARILFVKITAINDKTLCKMTEEVRKWLKDARQDTR